MKTIEIGTRVYNRGDMANPDHFGTVIANDGLNVTIESDNTVAELYPEGLAFRALAADAPYVYTVPEIMIATVDTGNGSTRIVTEAAYLAFRKARVDALVANMGGAK